MLRKMARRGLIGLVAGVALVQMFVLQDGHHLGHLADLLHRTADHHSLRTDRRRTCLIAIGHLPLQLELHREGAGIKFIHCDRDHIRFLINRIHILWIDIQWIIDLISEFIFSLHTLRYINSNRNILPVAH